jgi:glycosyltransferase involved in cell wall biosynthesis
MAQRIKLGLVFKYDEAWVAGSYYLLNLIEALKTLPENIQPEIILFTDQIEDRHKVENLGYKYLVHKKYIPVLNSFQKLINKISRMLSGKNLIEKRMRNDDVDYIFIQRRSWETDLLSNSKKIFWIPDCQELIMPELFFKRELEGRKHVYNEIITAESKILFSSNAALNDFKSFYPQAKNPMFVVNFAVVHPKFDHISIHDLKTKYHITQPYFMVPNQFWVHKNHKIVLEAALELRKQGFNFKIIFTGKENDFRAPTYTNELKQFVLEHQLSDVVSFLGFIPREEQLCLMKNSIAIVQPSLFEGWSTVVEDAKALNKWILLSDITVHREQIKENVDFFNPKKSGELALAMQTQIQRPSTPQVIDYKIYNTNFGKGFYQMLIQ